MTDHPDSWRVPWGVAWPLPVLAVGAAVVMVSFDDDVRFLGGMMIVVSIACALAGVRGRLETTVLISSLALYLGLVSWNWNGVAFGLGLSLFFLFTVRVSLWVLDVVSELDGPGTPGRCWRSPRSGCGSRATSTTSWDAGSRPSPCSPSWPPPSPPGATRGRRRRCWRCAAWPTRHCARHASWPAATGRPSSPRSRGGPFAAALGRHRGRRGRRRRPRGWHEPAGWVIREAVTNVLRHSTARAGQHSARRDDVLVSTTTVPVRLPTATAPACVGSPSGWRRSAPTSTPTATGPASCSASSFPRQGPT